VRQTVEALVRTVELSDPYLAGHSRLLRDIGGLVARRLDLPAGDIATVEIAATLSQIGKPLVPRHILTKPERLTSDEIEVMQTHIVHAVRVLEDIDFDLPVRETVEQLYERLDGTGYPNGLAGDRVHMRARILGVCDWFCARIRPRSYRTAIAPEEALQVLAEHPGKYDPEVVAALEAVLATPEGEKLLALSDAA
jgi:HD-GYP domain-containing protein (c-di-GMP phosphodiesterase class II)